MRAYTLGQGHEVTSISPIHRRRESGYRSDPPRRRLRRKERRRAKNPGSRSCALQGPSSSPSASKVPVSFFFASKILLVMESTTNQHRWAFASPAFLFGLASPIQGSGANGRCQTSLQGPPGGFHRPQPFFCISRDGGVHLGAAERPRTASIVRGTPFPHDTHSRLETSTGAHTVVVAVRCNVSALPPWPANSHSCSRRPQESTAKLAPRTWWSWSWGIGMFRLLPCCLSVSALTHGGGWALKRKQQRGRVGVSVISRD